MSARCPYRDMSMPRWLAARLLVERGRGHDRRAVAGVVHGHAPRPAAHLAVLDVVLRLATAGIEAHLVLFAAIRTGDAARHVGRTVAEWEIAVEVELVGARSVVG